jgi:putative phosphoesterase
MRILVFSDLHANKQALEDIIGVVREVDLSIFCGDILGYGTDIDYCIDYVTDNIDLVVLGNMDRMAVTDEQLDKQFPVVRESMLATRAMLSKEQTALLASLPGEIWHETFYITHSLGDDYLRDENDFARLRERMGEQAQYAFFGHTHEQVLYEHNNKIIVNPGSITKGRRGFPRSYTIIEDNNVKFVNLEAIL